MTDKEETITQEELQRHREMKVQVALAKLEAEKAVAASKITELEVQNFVLQLFMKYGLKINQDRVLETGKIVRAQQPEVVAEQVEEKVNG